MIENQKNDSQNLNELKNEESITPNDSKVINNKSIEEYPSEMKIVDNNYGNRKVLNSSCKMKPRQPA